MTQKELLLKDLCARLLYGVKSSDREEIITIRAYHPSGVIDDFGRMHNIENIKPYLFLLSSMTKEQKEEMKSFDPFKIEGTKTFGQWAVHLVDFYNKHHFDYRGLIEKGLALDATGLGIY